MGNPVAQNVFEDGRETALMRWDICLISIALLCPSAYKNVIKIGSHTIAAYGLQLRPSQWADDADVVGKGIS